MLSTYSKKEIEEKEGKSKYFCIIRLVINVLWFLFTENPQSSFAFYNKPPQHPLMKIFCGIEGRIGSFIRIERDGEGWWFNHVINIYFSWRDLEAWTKLRFNGVSNRHRGQFFNLIEQLSKAFEAQFESWNLKCSMITKAIYHSLLYSFYFSSIHLI